ncbi:hypothetical protein MTR_1g058370 [Medicago truncatula]|uniref:Uncharacterized protein n=1 Tax=Medicago truncatula TaxID=3880 RepID=A0A072VIX3_MEDTR|nr:hypothetical protein MTR_1g058370 [Medicago truncatula]
MVESLSKESLVETIVQFQNEEIVRAWTYHVLHLCIPTINIVESVYGRLKKYLTDSKRDLVRAWETKNNMLQL